MKPKFNPEINLGHLIQIGTILILGLGVIVRVELREAHQDNAININASKVERAELINDKQNDAIAQLDKLMAGMQERYKNVGGN